MGDETELTGLDERLGLSSRPTTLMEAITASITDAVRLETDRNTDVLGQLLAQVGRLDRHLASLAEVVDGTGHEGAVMARLDELGSRLEKLESLVTEPAPSAEMASMVDGLTELRRAMASARRAIDDGLQDLRATGPEPVDLAPVIAKLEEIAARPAPEATPVDLSPVIAWLEEIAGRPEPQTVDLDPVHAKLDALAARPERVMPAMPEPVDLAPVIAWLEEIAGRPEPQPTDLSPIVAKLDALVSRPEPQPVNVNEVQAAIARLAADIDAVRLLVAQASRAPDVARLLSDVSLLRQEVSATQDRLQGVDRTLIAFRAGLSGANDAQSTFRVSEAVAATAAAIARLERRVGVGLEELRDLIEHAAAAPPSPPTPTPPPQPALPAALPPGQTRERVAGQVSDRLARIREAAAGVSDAVRAERARRRGEHQV
jgi:hypothetical protein